MDSTNAERQRRYIAKLKAAAAQNAALRQQIAAPQEGLAMKAMKAAVTKPNGGVVGFLDANLEFHEAGCPPPCPLAIPSWVPKEARPAIEEMWNDTLPDKEVRTALKRLATDRKMKDGVWEKLRNVKGVAEIVPSAIEALVRSALLRAPPQAKQREALQRYQQHLDKLWINHPHPTGDTTGRPSLGGPVICEMCSTHCEMCLAREATKSGRLIGGAVPSSRMPAFNHFWIRLIMRGTPR